VAVATRTRQTLFGRDDEIETLQHLLGDARAGHSGVAVVEGEAGVGKTAILDCLAELADGMQIARAAGVEPEVDIPYSGLHQLLLPFLSGLARIPGPHRDALQSAFGLQPGSPGNRFFIGMAALALLSDAALKSPVLCIVDDAHRIDPASLDALGFAARRMVADRVAMVLAVREQNRPMTALQDLPVLELDGLNEDAALQLLKARVGGELDAIVARRVVAETRGNPLALTELARELSPAQLAGSEPIPDPMPLGSRLEDLYMTRIRALPRHVQTVLLLAAADPSGDPALLAHAADELGIGDAIGLAPEISSFLYFTPGFGFHHPLMRSAAYYGASAQERRRAHQALADASEPILDSDRRAWHLAAAVDAPDESIAAELEASAERARSRGGWSSAATFLERAAELTPDDGRRATRRLAGAHARLLAGEPAAARLALEQAAPFLPDALARARAMRLEGMIAVTLGTPSRAATVLLDAAELFAAHHDASAARHTLIHAFEAAQVSGSFAGGEVGRVLDATRTLAVAPAAKTAGDALLDGFATLQRDGDAAGIPELAAALGQILADKRITDEELSWLPVAWTAAAELYDDSSWQAITSRWARAARIRGPLIALRPIFGRFPYCDVITGRFAAAERGFEEARELVNTSGETTLHSGYAAAELAIRAWRGQATESRAVTGSVIAELTSLGRGAGIRIVHLATAVLELGLCNYSDALRAAQKASSDNPTLLLNVEPELIEAAVRCGELEAARAALEVLGARARASGTDWGLGMMLRCQALLATPREADELFAAAIEHLDRTLVVPQLARTHLLYGEWLRRQRRRRDARGQLRAAFDMLEELGAAGFAERAHIELQATGEHARRRTVETIDELTPQEEQIARLASDGATNMEIAMQLFISGPTVSYHLQKAYRKLGISNRASLARALRQRGAARPDLD
jgi:DNA-binding CsgD family transcriptional regulator